MKNSAYYKSLLDTMSRLKTMNLLYPDSLCFAGAQCHALNSGAEGYVGHNRSTEECRKKWYYNGECCNYGHNNPLDIIMSLLIDEDVPSLGHRNICLGSYKRSAYLYNFTGYTGTQPSWIFTINSSPIIKSSSLLPYIITDG